MRKKVISLLLAAVLVVALAIPSFAANGEHIRVTQPADAKVSVGGQYTLNLVQVFSDPSGHPLTYTLDAAENYSEHTKISDGVFYFSESTAGTYPVTITAGCPAGDTASVTFNVDVMEGNIGLPEQYGYNETPADSVKVYVTISCDGYPIVTENGTTVAHLEVEVPYFDLGLYGLEDYRRYGTDNGMGSYTTTTVVERPTALHLYIYMLERYYMGLSEEDCGTGASDVLSYFDATNVYNLNGDVAYSSDGRAAIGIAGSPTSMYMVNFWGHDENLMYYRNHVYPNMSGGWGATADYILLSDYDTIDLAMFSDWGFWTHGAFNRFDKDTYVVQEGDTLNFNVLKYATTYENAGFVPQDELDVYIYSSDWKEQYVPDPVGGDYSSYSYTFDTAGEYYLLGLDGAAGGENSDNAPATAKVIVNPKQVVPTVKYGDVNGDGKINSTDAAMAYAIVRGNIANPTQSQLAALDVNVDGSATAIDAAMIYARVRGDLPVFPVEQ